MLKRLGTANYTTVPDNSANWDQAFGWGDHAQAGYLKTYNPNDSVDASELEVLFGPLGAGLMIREASGDFKTTPNNHRQWDTAYNNIIQYASNWQTAFSERTLKCCSRALDFAAESTERIGICANRTPRKTQLPER